MDFFYFKQKLKTLKKLLKCEDVLLFCVCYDTEKDKDLTLR